MAKKFIICALSLIFLVGCGAEGTAADAMPNSGNMVKSSQKSMEAPSTSERIFVNEKSNHSSDQEDTAEDAIKVEGSSESQYFTFTRRNSIIDSAEGITLLTENRCDIRFFSEAEETEQWIDKILLDNQEAYDANSRSLIQYAQEVISQYGAESFYTYSNYEDQGIMRHDNRVVSIVSISNIFSGGAHPNTVQTVKNLDLEERRTLKLEDVIYEESALDLEEIVQDTVESKYNRLDIDALYKDYSDTIATSMKYGSMTPCWYFGYDSLVIFYNQYELGPYASGIIKVEIPYGKLHGILREEFFPETTGQCTGDLKVISDLQGQKAISCAIEPDGSQIFIQADGPVYSVQVSEVLWVDKMPVSQSMMISIDEMNEHDVLALTGGIEDESRSFAIEYTTDCGNRNIYYIHPEGLSHNP